jgi:hypothetical protein
MMETRPKKKGMIGGIASCIAVLVCFAGCSTIEVRHSERSSGPLEKGDVLALVLDHRDHTGRSLEEAASVEAGLSECLRRALKEGAQSVTLIPPDEFRRIVFPDLDGASAPASAEILDSVLEAPHVRQKIIDALQLRYLIMARQGTVSQWKTHTAPDGGHWTHTKTTLLWAHIIDVKNATETGDLTTTAESSGFYAVLGILPIIVPAGPTESPACKRFGTEIVKFISGETDNKPAGDTP